MSRIHLQKLNTHLEFLNKNEIIIWCVHDKNFCYGTYYKINTITQKVYFVIEKEQEHYEQELNFIGENNAN